MATSANALENEIHHQGSHVELKLNEVTTHLDFIVAQLNRIYHPVPQANSHQKFDINKAKGIIEKLKPCLMSANIQAEDIAKELMKIAYETPYHEQIIAIEKQVSDFDFDDALAALLTLEEAIVNAN